MILGSLGQLCAELQKLSVTTMVGSFSYESFCCSQMLKRVQTPGQNEMIVGQVETQTGLLRSGVHLGEITVVSPREQGDGQIILLAGVAHAFHGPIEVVQSRRRTRR